jgi:FtsP/CotA-like multicopper oxidase with cupredoxin domain
MTLLRTFMAAAIAVGLTSAPALAERPRGSAPPASAGGPARDSDRAFQATQQGRSIPLPQLERKVMPFMGGADYLGPEINGGGVTRMKFMQNGRVIWVDVDGQGRIIRRSRDK